MQAIRSRFIGTALGFVLDAAVGEPPIAIHPVVGIGNALLKSEDRLYANSRSAGATYLATGLIGAVAVGHASRKLLPPTGVNAGFVAFASARKMLNGTALGIGELLENGQLEQAREALPSLVGRDPRTLREQAIVRAVIESVAENTVDAVIATLLFGHAFGPAGILAHRVANTMDAMVGHKSEKYLNFGWAAAKFDDVLAYVPARATMAAVICVRPGRARHIIATVVKDAPKHPSPNGGVAEASFAAALNIRLGGTNVYNGIVENRGELGTGEAPTAKDIRRATRLANQVGALVAFAPLIVVLAAKRFR